MGVTISPHRQEYVAECYDEDKVVPRQSNSVVTPGSQFGTWVFITIDIDHNSHLSHKTFRAVPGREKGGYLLLGYTRARRTL